MTQLSFFHHDDVMTAISRAENFTDEQVLNLLLRTEVAHSQLKPQLIQAWLVTKNYPHHPPSGHWFYRVGGIVIGAGIIFTSLVSPLQIEYYFMDAMARRLDLILGFSDKGWRFMFQVQGIFFEELAGVARMTGQVLRNREDLL